MVRYSADGTSRWYTLGDWPVLTADQARKLARERLGEVAGGGDPAAERKRRREALTVKELVEAYVERYAKPHKRTWAKDEARLNRHLLPAMGSRKAAEVTRADVANVHRTLGATRPTEANRLLENIRKAFNWAVTEGLLPEGHPNPGKGVRRWREKARERWLRPEELERVAQAIDAEENPLHRAFFWGLLFTGCRLSELLNAKWSDLLTDPHGGRVLHLVDTKNGDKRNVPLPPQFTTLLEALPRVDGNPYVFPSPMEVTTERPAQPMGVPRHPWDRIRSAAGVEDVHLHDFRATVGTMLAADGFGSFEIKKALGHKSDAAVKVYVRLGEDAARTALDHSASRIAELAKGKRTRQK
jgi:integrase